MSHSRKLTLALLCGLLGNTETVFAHTEFKTNAGIISNVIALALVILSIVIFLLVDKRNKKKDHNKQQGV